MKLSSVKKKLENLSELRFRQSNGEYVPAHFHVTEIGKVSKDFIDCGGTLRQEKRISFQLFSAEDYDHRLAPQKLRNIITLSEKQLGLEDWEVEVEFQSNTIGKYALDFEDGDFVLVSTQTDCLAKDNCGIPTSKPKVQLSDLPLAGNSCAPGSGCC